MVIPAAAVLTRVPQVGASVGTLPVATAICLSVVVGRSTKETERQLTQKSVPSPTASPRSFFGSKRFFQLQWNLSRNAKPGNGTSQSGSILESVQQQVLP
jgi:hypothetical protein